MKETLVLALLFSAGSLVADEVPAAQANNHVGENTSVCGLVTGIHQARNSRGKPTFINLDKPYPAQDFTVMIWDDDRPAFGNLDQYNGKQICAHGRITEYHGKPEMVLHSANSLTEK